jgi:hypothetical protein
MQAEPTEADIQAAREVAEDWFGPDGWPSLKNESLVTSIARALASARAEDAQWQPIETAPKDGTSILVWSDDAEDYYLVTWAEGHGAWFNGDVLIGEMHFGGEPSHWMPLPLRPRALLAPKEQADGE